MTMDTNVQDPKELQVFAAFLTNENGQTPAPAPPSGEPGAQPKRRRENENPPEGTSQGSGSTASAPGIYLSMPQGSGNHPKGKGKNKGKGKGGKGKGQPPPRHQQGDWSSSSSEWSQGWNQGWGSNGSRYQGDLVMQISKLLLRHELQLQNLQGDTKLHLYLRTGAQSFLPSLFAIAREWGKLYREEPAKLGMSLRETLLVALLREMATRAKLAMNRADSKQAALDLKWINSTNQWSYMQWNPHTAQLDLLEEPAPRDHSEILQDIERMIELVDGDTVKRFASAKTLVAEPQSEWVEFILEVGLREKGHQLWDLILRFNQCCVLHPLGARIRRDRPGLSGLAETIRNMLRLPAIQGYWQQRRLEEDVGAVVCDTTTMVIPITMALPEGTRGLQHCIQAWHSGHYRSAITGDPPELICLHLSRFRQTDGGDIVKDVQALPDIREVIRLPVFRSPADITVRWCPYQVCAASLHFGPRVERGHYRALLRSKEKTWITEDNRGAQLLSCTELSSLTPHIYLLWCVLDSGLPVAAGNRTTLCN
ncbi:unnamed protein product [Symbiodinium sp. CCMP2592]|nr:unnamed protein product [Symbiodinium sp. CCMP2592]